MTLNEEDIVLKVLHTADWHLGKRFRTFGQNETKLRRARLEVIERILSLAERHAVHAVLCAGDLFDDPMPDQAWWQGLADLFRKKAWKDRPVFLLPGNHDPLLADSVWAMEHKFRRSLPDWVHVIDRELVEHPLPGNGVLYAVPCRNKAGQADPTETIPKRQAGDERIRIGLAHGSTFDLADCQVNFPIHRDAALRSNLDYLAIGDTHGFRFVPPDRKLQPTVYPGAPEPTAFDEVAPGKVAIVFFNRRREARVQDEHVAHWMWEEITVRNLLELQAVASRSDLANRVMRLHVEMSIPPREMEDAERLLENLTGTEAKPGRVGILDLHRDGLVLDTSDPTSLAELPELLQEAAKRLKALESDPRQAETAKRALAHLCRLARKAS